MPSIWKKYISVQHSRGTSELSFPELKLEYFRIWRIKVRKLLLRDVK